MSRWFKSAAKSETPMNATEELQQLQVVEQALLLLLNDDIAEADRILKQQDSSYHYLGRGISSFLASLLGVEKDLLKNAAALLLAAEEKSWEDMKKAEHQPTAFKSAIYPPGTEYAVCYSIAQLTSAITAVLSGSITEAVRGFYKLRKAYLTLDGILEVESNYLKQRAVAHRISFPSQKDTPPSTRNGSSADVTTMVTDPQTLSDRADKINSASIDIPEGFHGGDNTSTQTGAVLPPSTAQDTDLTPADSRTNTPTKVMSRRLNLIPEMDPTMLTHHTDIFIYSGSHLCFGLLLIVLSMVNNPVFNRILYIIGFSGDRERGVELLWQSTQFSNFNSAIAGLGLLGYYNGLIGFCDILPTDPAAEDDLSGYPKGKCRALLAEMRRRYPESKLWKLEEARSLSYDCNLEAAVQILTENSDSNMKQIAVINMFEKSLTTMFFHDYTVTAESWLKCAELNSWSVTVYYYMAGCAYLELYRNLRDNDPAGAKDYKTKATEYISKAPSLAGRHKVMSKQLPFDVFIVRKVQKWEERSKAWGVDLVDSIGTSPLMEMMYLWNGIKKMGQVELEKSLAALRWDRTTQPEKHEADLDEVAICALLRACVLRNMQKFENSRSILYTEILSHDKSKFKGHLKDDWTCPSAHYEMACLAWHEKDLDGTDHKAKVLDCEQWLDKTQKFDSYVLDTRMGLKITTSLATVKRHKKIMNI